MNLPPSLILRILVIDGPHPDPLALGELFHAPIGAIAYEVLNRVVNRRLPGWLGTAVLRLVAGARPDLLYLRRVSHVVVRVPCPARI